MGHRIVFGEQAFPLMPGESLIGRDTACAIQLNHRSVSRRHARILLVGDVVTLEDLGSRNGTFVNEVRLAGPSGVPSGAEIRVGTQTFCVVKERRSWPTDETEESKAVPLVYKVPSMRTCLGCRHLVSADQTVCPLCGTDQRAMPSEVTVKVFPDTQGRRSARRFRVKLRGLYVSPNLTVECELSDISATGALVRAPLLDEPGTPCDLVIFVAKDDVVRLPGQVARTDETGGIPGMGVQFGELGTSATLWVSSIASPEGTGLTG